MKNLIVTQLEVIFGRWCAKFCGLIKNVNFWEANFTTAVHVAERAKKNFYSFSFWHNLDRFLNLFLFQTLKNYVGKISIEYLLLHSGPENLKRSKKKNSWNQINQFFFSWNCIFGSFKLFPSSKIDVWPFLKLQKMEFGQKKFSWNWFFGLDFFRFSGQFWNCKILI